MYSMASWLPFFFFVESLLVGNDFWVVFFFTCGVAEQNHTSMGANLLDVSYGLGKFLDIPL